VVCVLVACKVTIHQDFVGHSQFNNMSRKNSVFPVYAHLSHFWRGVPDLFPFANLCSRMLTHLWPKVSSDFICIYEKIAGGSGELMTLPYTSKSDPQMARACGARTL